MLHDIHKHDVARSTTITRTVQYVYGTMVIKYTYGLLDETKQAKLLWKVHIGNFSLGSIYIRETRQFYYFLFCLFRIPLELEGAKQYRIIHIFPTNYYHIILSVDIILVIEYAIHWHLFIIHFRIHTDGLKHKQKNKCCFYCYIRWIFIYFNIVLPDANGAKNYLTHSYLIEKRFNFHSTAQF